MRKTGVRILGDLPWGRHLALFYETKEDLLETCVPFLKAGLESNEVCAWVSAEPLTEKDGLPCAKRLLPSGDTGVTGALKSSRARPVLHRRQP